MTIAEWPIVIAGEWRHYEARKGRKTHVIFIDYTKHAATNSPQKSELHLVADACYSLLMHIWQHLSHKGGNSTLRFGEFIKHKVHGAGHGMGGKLLAAITHRIQEASTPETKLGVIYGLDVPGNDQPDDPFQLSRDSAHRVILLLSEWESAEAKYAEGHYNYYVNGPVGPFGGEGPFQAQPGCKESLKQHPRSCSYQRSLNLFRTSLTDADDHDSLLVGFRFEANPNVQIVNENRVHPYLSAMMQLNRAKMSVFGINNDYGDVYPAPDAEVENYFVPTAPCSPYNLIENKLKMKLPKSGYEYTYKADSSGAREMKFYRFSEIRMSWNESYASPKRKASFSPLLRRSSTKL